ncbi:hypothetical protein B566_EDAN016999, partial [Ephemera danica]
VNYLKKSYIHVKVADQRVILYKTPEITIETEIKKLQDSLEEAKISLEAMETCNTLIEEYRFGMEQACAATKPVAFVGQKHEELQKSAIQKFEEWTKKNEIALTQKHRQDFITLVVPSCRKCYVAYHGKEYGYEEYEILVRN